MVLAVLSEMERDSAQAQRRHRSFGGVCLKVPAVMMAKWLRERLEYQPEKVLYGTDAGNPIRRQ